MAVVDPQRHIRHLHGAVITDRVNAGLAFSIESDRTSGQHERFWFFIEDEGRFAIHSRQQMAIVGCATPHEQASTRHTTPILAENENESGRTNQSEVTSELTAEARFDAEGDEIRTVAFDDSSDSGATGSSSPADLGSPASRTSSADDVPIDPRGEYAVDLATILALVAGENPQVQFAQWRIQEAYARLDGAEVLWLPSIQAGVSYHRHDGTLQASDGTVIDVNRSSFQGGLGAGAVGAGSLSNPGLVARFHTTDAIFAPRIAERTAWARSHAAKAVLHDQLLGAALAYLEMLNASQQYAISQETLFNTHDLAVLTGDFAEAGQGLQADADRMAAELAIRKNDLIRADEAIAVASVRLAEVASVDFTARLVPIESTVIPIELVPVDLDRQGLIAVGLSNRPELKEAGCLVAEAVERLQREKYAPLLPSVLLGMSYSGFGGGLGNRVGSVRDRADFDALAVWEVRNLGFGEHSARDTVRTQIEQRRWERVRRMNRVAREVAEAAAQVESRRRQISVSEDAIAIARLSYQRNLHRIRDGQGLPIEALQSIQALNTAQREYLRAVVSYNEVQFRLHRALGWPVTEGIASGPK